jgi:hypothetical protein
MEFQLLVQDREWGPCQGAGSADSPSVSAPSSNTTPEACTPGDGCADSRQANQCIRLPHQPQASQQSQPVATLNYPHLP